MAHDNCKVCGEHHDNTRKIHWDGHGINSCGMYRDRIATFRREYTHLGKEYENAINSHEALVSALEELRKELRSHIKLDVKKHFSLMVADAAAGTALNLAKTS